MIQSDFDLILEIQSKLRLPLEIKNRDELKLPEEYYDLILDNHIYEEIFNLLNLIFKYTIKSCEEHINSDNNENDIYLEIDELFCKYLLGFVEHIDMKKLDIISQYILNFDISVLDNSSFKNIKNTYISLLLLLYKFKQTIIISVLNKIEEYQNLNIK
jgi:hypothetical protein